MSRYASNHARNDLQYLQEVKAVVEWRQLAGTPAEFLVTPAGAPSPIVMSKAEVRAFWRGVIVGQRWPPRERRVPRVVLG